MVQAKAKGTIEDQDLFSERCTSLFQSTGLIKGQEELARVSIPAEPFRNVPWEDETAANLNPALVEELERRAPLIILDDERFKQYSPQLRSDLTQPRIYLSTFGPFLEWIDETLSAAAEAYEKANKQ